MTQNSQLQQTDVYAHLIIRYSAGYTEYLDLDLYRSCENTVVFLEALSNSASTE